MNEINGEKKSWIDQRRDDLNDWENKVGIIKLSLEDEVKNYLYLSSQDRKKLTSEECGHISLSLFHYSSYVNKLMQEIDSEIFLLDEKIKQIVLDRINQQQAYKFEEKLMLAIAENNEASKMNREKFILQAKHKRISYYASKIDNIAKSYQNLSISKKRDKTYED